MSTKASIETLVELRARLGKVEAVNERLDAHLDDPADMAFLVGWLTAESPDAMAAALDALEECRAAERTEAVSPE